MVKKTFQKVALAPEIRFRSSRDIGLSRKTVARRRGRAVSRGKNRTERFRVEMIRMVMGGSDDIRH